jgi:hypothetical protein
LMFECDTECPRDGFLSRTSQRFGISSVYGERPPRRYVAASVTPTATSLVGSVTAATLVKP